jgi:hypothetical protein
MVRLSGASYCYPTQSLPAIIATLPAGFRPARNVYVSSCDILAEGFVVSVVVTAAGAVEVLYASSSSALGVGVTLDPITFPVD